MPPRTATATRRAHRHDARAQRGQDQQHHRDPAEAVGEAEDHLALRQAGHEPDHQQARVDRRVREREPLEHGQREARPGCRPGRPARRSCRRPVEHPRHPPQHLVGLVGPLADVGRPPARDRRARASRATSAPDGSQACPTNITIWWGSSTSASPRTRSGSTDHSSRSSRASVSTGFSSSSTEPPAPSAQRPGPRREPCRAPARQPAPVAVAHDAQRRDRAAGVALDEAQRPARRLEVEHELAVGADLVADEPRRRRRRGSASRARRAPRPRRRRRS